VSIDIKRRHPTAISIATNKTWNCNQQVQVFRIISIGRRKSHLPAPVIFSGDAYVEPDAKLAPALAACSIRVVGPVPLCRSPSGRCVKGTDGRQLEPTRGITPADRGSAVGPERPETRNNTIERDKLDALRIVSMHVFPRLFTVDFFCKPPDFFWRKSVLTVLTADPGLVGGI
jgi:hypothetical protein